MYFSLIVLLLLGVGSTSCLDFDAKLSNARLPNGVMMASSVYDGENSIYIIGGVGTSGYENKVLKYSLDSDTVQHVGTLPLRTHAGAAAIDSQGIVWYLGGYETPFSAFTYNPVTHVTRWIPWDTSVMFSGTVQTDGETVYRLGGFVSDRAINRINLTDQTHVYIKSFPEQMSFSVALYDGLDNAYVIPYNTWNSNQVPVKFTMSTGELKNLNLPRFCDQPVASSDGRYGYVLGGNKACSSPIPNSGLLRFDLKTEEWETHPIANFTDGDELGYSSGTAVYVKKLHRLYVFGGELETGSQLVDRIWSIDLPEEDWADCTGRPNGYYPHPANCAKYFGCVEGVATQYECPEPLLFDAVTQTCNYPEFVVCENY